MQCENMMVNRKYSIYLEKFNKNKQKQVKN